jgi:hypothetical protein
MFDLAAGKQLHTTINGGSASLSAHAAVASDGAIVVILNNKDDTHAVVANVDFGTPRTSATLLTLTAPSLASTSGVLLGNAPIASDGTWTPSRPNLSVAGSVAAVPVFAGSAVLIRAQ